MSTQLSNLCVVWVGNISFQEISYACKPQVVSRYILSNLWGIHTVANSTTWVMNTIRKKSKTFSTT